LLPHLLHALHQRSYLLQYKLLQVFWVSLNFSNEAYRMLISQSAAPGKGPAQFHLTPSKKAPKLDLGEAYLKAQESKIAAATVASQSKARCDLVVALTMQGKTAIEIAEFLLLCGL
jgi:hypothetical protein